MAVAATLPACASLQDALQPAAPPNRVASAPPVVAPEPAPDRGLTASRPRAPGPETARAAPVLVPEQLVGIDPAKLETLLGRPSSVHDEPPATVWTYRAGVCSLDVFFFMSVETKAMKALAYDLKPPQRPPAARNDCFDSIVAEARDRR